MSTSGKLKLLLEAEAQRSLGPTERRWFLPKVRQAEWRSLRRDFPLLWGEVHTRPGSLSTFDLEGLLARTDIRDYFREDVLLLAQREGLPVRAGVLGSGRSGAIRRALVETVAAQRGLDVARVAAQATRAWRWQQYREHFPEAWEASANGLPAAGDPHGVQELLMRAPAFEDFAQGIPAALVAADFLGRGEGPPVVEDGLPHALESISESGREIVADLGNVATDVSIAAEDAADAIVEVMKFMTKWTVRGVLGFLGVGGVV